MTNSFQKYINLIEAADGNLKQNPLSYSRNDLEPVLSKEAMDFHFGKLAKAYVDRYNSGEGDADFNKSGAVLHNILFAQFKPPGGVNKPTGNILEFINKHHTDYESFKNEVEKVAMGIQGSGWVYLAKNGQIKTIKNHQIKNDIILLIDWWEHSWYLDYGPDKKKYLSNIWKIIDWSIIDSRLTNVDL